METVAQLVRELGLPTALAVFMIFALWRAAVWMGRDVLKPLAVRHMKFLDRLEALIEKMTITSISAREVAAEALKEIKDHREEFKELMSRWPRADSSTHVTTTK